MKSGALHVCPDRQLMTPFPNSPPITNAAFFMPGITATHSDLFQVSSGMPFSGIPRSSRTTVAASSRRFASEEEISARAVEALNRMPIESAAIVFIAHTSRVPSCSCKIESSGAPAQLDLDNRYCRAGPEALAATGPPQRKSASHRHRIDQGQPGLPVEAAVQRPRRFRHDDLQRRPHGRFDEMAAMRGRVRFADDDVRVNLRLVVLDGDVANQREDLDL